ncbi:VOC family protein [Leptothoe sp. PORK10 BA2]|uniref:VOC family protein n=1 Tax=Leptothoe sp. PORK10 BA2 TaxID=3110254 RepID=UPI002B1EA35C|nr:VOC family protein [Leptothoe sp. PORK10 BA2]MEA5462562.1 VOC family protein [Leptothoe sp. PORK10 BA2]
MIAYTLVGTNDLEKSTAFYDALLAEIGGKQAVAVDRVILYAGAEGTPFFGIAQPANGQPANVGNGSMVSLGAKSPEEVDRLHAKALDLGASDEGAPGPRTNQGLNFYAGYFRDPDGNKLNFFYMG